MNRPSHSDVSDIVEKAMMNPDVMESARAMIEHFQISYEEAGGILFDHTNIAVIAGISHALEFAFGEGFMNTIVGEFMDEELAKILAGG